MPTEIRSAQVTTANGNDELVKLDGTGRLPSVDGSQLTGVSGGVENPMTAHLDTGGFNIVTAATAGLTPSDSIKLQAGYVNGDGVPGSITIKAGQSGGTTGGGDLILIGGRANNTATGGDVSLSGGDGLLGGVCTINGGEGGGNGGELLLKGGRASVLGLIGDGGNTTIIGGYTSWAGQAGGHLMVYGGHCSDVGTGTGGDVIIAPGRGATTDGVVSLHAAVLKTGESSLQFWSDTDTGHTAGNYVALKAPSTVADRTWTLPQDDPAALGTGSPVGQYFLTTNNAGELSFAAAAGGGTPGGVDTELQYNNGGAFGGTTAWTFDDTTAIGKLTGSATISSDSVLSVTNATTVGTSASAILGNASAASGTVNGVRGESSSISTDAAGVYGRANGGSGLVRGVFGYCAGTGGDGVYGFNPHGSNSGNAVHGVNNSTVGAGALFENIAGDDTDVWIAKDDIFFSCKQANVENFKVTGAGDVTAAGNVVSHIAINTQTGTTYPIVLTDDGKFITMNNGGANTATIPANATIAFPVGTKIKVNMLGTGVTSIDVTTDTINGTTNGTAVALTQYQVATLTKITATVWNMTVA